METKNNGNTKFFYGFVILIVSTIGIWATVPGQTVGVSTFTDPVKDALNLSRNQISWAYTIGTIVSSLFLGIGGKWFDKYGARRVSVGAAVLLSLSLMLCSFSASISSYLQIILGYNSFIIPFIVIAISFFAIRFSGQGLLSLSSRNVLMLWFEEYRGRVNAINSVAVSLGFSISPLWIDLLIKKYDWTGAWQLMALGLLVIAVILLVFIRNKPSDLGQKPDGNLKVKSTNRVNYFNRKQFTRSEALKTRAFWSYSLMLAFDAFFITGLTFHIISVFNSVGLSHNQAISIFLPTSVISLIISLFFNTLSDKIKLKYILLLMIFGGIISVIGLYILHLSVGYYLLILGNGLMGGLFSVLIAVVWPKFYGRKHLGAISGVTMQMIVFASALGPLAFSYSFKLLNSYKGISLISIFILVAFVINAIKTENPQEI